MKAKIIALIKKYRAESEKYWNPETGCKNSYDHGYVTACDKFTDDLEKLLKEDKS